MINCAAIAYHPELRGTILDEPWVTPVSPEELLAPYEGWDAHLLTLLKVCFDLSMRTMRRRSPFADVVENDRR